MIEVVGIDAQEESRRFTVPEQDSGTLAAKLCRRGWKYALLLRDGKKVGGVVLDAGARHRKPV